jgi:TolB-like protein/Tfp pilus assembly protein PilF
VPDVFLSYNREDQAVARRFAEAFQAAGLDVWWDTTLRAGEAYDEVTEAALSDARAVVVLWSPRSVVSRWVRAEATQADRNKTLVPVTIEPCRRPIMFELTQTADLSGWEGDAGDAAWLALLADVRRFVGARVAAAGEPRIAPQATSPGAAAAPPLPDEPSIAVLPFADPAGADEGDYFADGMVDEIVTALARFQSLFVIASGSGLSYRERERDFRRIGRELGVRYLLEGSVRRSAPRVRIAADLVEAEAGGQIWSERFEGTLDDVFALQDEVANAVAARIMPTIEAADLRRGAARPTDDLGAYDLFLRGQQRVREFDNASAQAAIVLFEQAVARDPTFAGAWAALAYMHTRNLLAGWTADREETRRKAQDAIRHALLANGDDAIVLAQVANAGLVLGGDARASLAMADRALTLNPGSSLCWVHAGYVSMWCEQYQQALERLQHALRLNPRAPDRYTALRGAGQALVRLERFDEAIPWLNEAITLRPNYPNAIFNLAIALAHLGRIDEAKAALARAEALGSLKSFIDTVVGGRSETFLSGLKRLGVDV